jgi:hypothetical protein
MLRVSLCGQAESILPADLRFLKGGAFAGRGEVFVNWYEMIFQ